MSVLYNQSSVEKAAIARVFKTLCPFKIQARNVRPKSQNKDEFDYNLLSRPDKQSNLNGAAYKVPADRYDDVFKLIMESTFQKGVSFTFSEQLDNKHGALVFDLDLHVDPSRIKQGSTGGDDQDEGDDMIQRKSEIEAQVAAEAEEKGWTTAKQQQTEVEARLEHRSKIGRVLTKEALTSFMECVAKILAKFADSRKFHDQIPVAMDYHIRQRVEPKFQDFDNGKPHYDDGAHIQINLDCTVEERIFIRHSLMESESLMLWYTKYICDYLYERAYSLYPEASSATAATSFRNALATSSSYIDDQYAISKIVDYSVSRGSSAFSVIGSHKLNYQAYVLTQYGALKFRVKEPDRNEDDEAEDEDEDEEASIQLQVSCLYSQEDPGVLRDWNQEISRTLPKAIKGCMTIKLLVLNNTISFSARSQNKRAYVASSAFFGSRLYNECMQESFKLMYKRHNMFYVPVEGMNLLADSVPRKKQQKKMANARKSFLDEDDNDDDEEEGDEECTFDSDDMDAGLSEIIQHENKKRQLSGGDDGDEDEFEEQPRSSSSKPPPRKKSKNNSSVAAAASASGKSLKASISKKKNRKRSAHDDDEAEEEEEEEDEFGELDEERDEPSAPMNKRQKKAQKITHEIDAAVSAAKQGIEYHGAFDYRRFQDMNRGNLFMVTEFDLMQCAGMEDLDLLYSKFIHSLDNENPASAGSNDDIRQACMCAMALPEKYYCVGSRDERIRVCWALHNISEYLLVVWVKFVFKRDDKDFSRMGEWIENWNSARTEDQQESGNNRSRPGSGNGYQLGSLRHWVMIHDPKKLAQITNAIFSLKVEKMIDDVTINVMMAASVFNNQSRMKSICIGDFQMAQLAEFLVGDRIVLCSYPTSGNVIWMKYNEKSGLWKRHATGLSCELSLTLAQYFRNHLTSMGAKLVALPQSGKSAAEMKKETEMLTRKMQEVLNVQTRLANHTGKCMIINEAKNLLYRDNFLSELDSNPFLFAFTNGVMDFSVSPPLFRKAEPLDYISVNCGSPYLEEYDGTSKTLNADELKQLYITMDELVYEYGRERLEAFPDKYSRFENEEDKIDEAGCDAIRSDPSILFKALPERFQPIATEITEYMRQMFEDPVTRSYAYKLICLPLVGCTLKNQFAHLFTGKGKNGKSVFSVDLFKLLYGGYYYAMDIRYWIQASGKAGSAQPELVQARTARWMPSFEPPKGSTINENTLKLFVGGTDPVNCRTLFEPPIQYIPQFTCAIVSNHNMGMESYDNGGTRRLRSLYFGTYFYDEEAGPLQTNSGKPIYQFKKDPNLSSRMKLWPTVLNWMSTKLYQLIGGALPSLLEVPEIKFHTENFFNDFDVEGAFIRTFLRCDKDSMVLKSDLNRKYKEWHMNQFAKEPSNIKSLHQRIGDFVESKQDQVFDDGWYGLKLL